MTRNLLYVRRLQLYALFVLLLFVITHGQSFGQNFPSGFSRVQVVNTGTTVTNMDFAPDGRIFINHQDGRIRMYKNGVLSTLITLSNVRNGGEDGLSGIILDPAFATNGYMYVYYTMNTMVNRLARLTLSGDAVVAQKTLIDIPLLSTTSQRHNGGALRFKDGFLYVTVGENDVNSAAQNKDNYNGKVLRLNPADGTPVVGNPFFNDAGANQARKSIWSMGERNPWAMDISPSTKKVFVCNVGQTFAEEINDVTVAGTNSGYPIVNSSMEGNSNNPAYKNPIYYYTNPNYTPATTSEGCAITGGAFMESPATNYPATYIGKFFFTDWCNNWINYIDPSTGTRTTFATGVGAASPNASTLALRVGIDGNLYYSQNGVIYKIIYTNNSAPVITNQPVSQTVIAGQPVTFSVSASGATPMNYQWKKNGVNLTTNANGSSYTITSVSPSDAGNYSVTITNGFSPSATSNNATLTVQPYNAPPVPTIVTPASGLTYFAGQSFSFSGTASDPEDGSLPASAFRWNLYFHHNEHFHDLQVGGYALGTKTGSFTTATEGEREVTVWYRLTLIVTDNNGLTGSTYVDITPQLSTISFVTQPAGLQIMLNGSPQTTPYQTEGVEGVMNELNAIQYQTLNGVNYEFDHWEHGGNMVQNFAIPTNNTTYTAVFVPSNTITTTLNSTKDAYVKDGANAATNFGATDPTKIETKLDVTANSGFNREGYLGFDLSTLSGTINSAYVKVYGNAGDANIISVAMHSSSNTTWAETTTNWNNKPVTSATSLATTDVSNTSQYYLWDVSSYIQAEKAAGRNLVTFNMKNMTTSTPQTVWSSKEGANPPQLVVTVTPATVTQSPFGGTAISIPGKIEAENYDLGGQGVAYNDATPGNSGGAYRTDDVDVQVATEGGYNIGYSAAGDWTEYTVNVTSSGLYNFEFRVAAIAAGKTIHLEVDGVNVTGAVSVPVGTGWQDFKSVFINNIQLTQGQRVFRIVMDTADENINYVNVTSATTSTDPFTQSYYNIVNKHSTHYLRPKDASATNLIVQDAEATPPGMDSFQWEFRLVAGTTNFYYLINKWTQMAVFPTASSIAENATLSQIALTGNENNQALHWAIEPVAGDPGYYWLKNRLSAKYIRPAGASQVDLTNIIQNAIVDPSFPSYRWSLVVRGAKSARMTTNTSETSETKSSGVYPNPAEGSITVVAYVNEKANVSVSIYNVSGTELFTQEFPDIKGHFERTFNVSGFAAGEFVVKVKNGDSIESHKVIKK